MTFDNNLFAQELKSFLVDFEQRRKKKTRRRRRKSSYRRRK